MNPRGALPGANNQKIQSDMISLVDRVSGFQALRAVGLPAAVPLAPKPLRRSKERLPIASDIDTANVLNTQDRGIAVAELEQPAPQVMVSASFDGVMDNGTTIPPDTTGAVSNNYVFNPLNNDIGVFDRTGSSLLSISLDDFWNTFHPGISTFDPKVVYDQFAQRFIFVTVANAQQSSSSLLIAVTENDDPTGNWATLRLEVDPNQQGAVWLDYPSLGFSKDKITVQLNLFTIVGNNFAGSSVYVFDKQEFYDPPHNPSVSLFVLTDQGGTQVPAITYDPNLETQFLLTRWTGDFQGDGYLALYEITGSVANQTAQFNRRGFIRAVGQTWSSFSPNGDFAPQLGTSRRIDCGDDRLLTCVYRDGALWCSHTVYVPASSPTRTAAQWWQVDTNTNTVQQLGRVEDTQGTKFYAYPTISVNQDSDAMLGMSEFSSQQHPSAAYAYRLSNDSAGQMRGPIVFAPGRNSYFKTFGGSANRWGDYSATHVDPLNDKDFWTVQEFASAQQNMWGTKWAHIIMGSTAGVV